MSEGQEHNREGELPIAALLRLAADGELTAEQEAMLREHLDAHPDDGERIEFERRLREACRCACAPECCAPKGLRDRVVAACCEPAAGPEARAAETRDRSFWAQGLVVRFGAVAALIALVALMSFMVGRSGSPNAGPPAATQEVLLGQVAGFVRKEHGRCEGFEPQADVKFTVTEAEEVEPAFAGLAGREISLSTILGTADHGLRFVDGGQCRLPGGGVAMHLRFATEADGAPVSVWAAVDTSLDLVEGETYVAGQGDQTVRLWRVGEVRYVLVSSSEGGATVASGLMGCPKRSRPCGGS